MSDSQRPDGGAAGVARDGAADGKKPSATVPTRERILEAARTIALDHGYKGTTLAMIQKRAGVHAGSFYWHFKDKDALFAELVRQAHKQSQVMEQPLEDGEDSNPLQVMLSSIVDNPRRYGLWRFNLQLMLDRDMLNSATAEEIRALRRMTQCMLTDAWVGKVPANVLERHPDLPGQMADYALATVEGCVLSRIAGTQRDEGMITEAATSVIAAMVAQACREVGEPVPDFFDARARTLMNAID